MGGLVLLVLLDAPEVPLDGLFVVLHQLVVHPDVVVAGGVLGTGLTRLLVPLYCSFVLLQLPPVHNTNLVEGPSEFGVVLSHLRDNLYLPFICGLIPSQNEQANSTVGLKFKEFVGHFL